MKILFLTSLLYLILITCIYFSKEKINSRENKIYKAILITNIFGLILDFLQLELSGRGLPITLLIIINKVFLIYVITWTTFFSIYVVNIGVDSKFKKYKYFLVNWIIFFLLIVVLPVNYHSSNNGLTYSDGLAIDATFLYVGILIMVCFINTIKKIKKDKSKIGNFIPLLFFIVLGTVGAVIQFTHPGVLLTSPVETFVTILTFFFIENPDVKMIQALNEAKISAEKANRAKSDFLSNMSHEIRTPLNAIVGFSDCILEEETLEDAKSDAKDIKLASENLLEIVNGILDISKIEADKMEIVETEYNPYDVLDNVAKLVKPRIGEKPIEFNVKLAQDIPYMIYGDGGKLRQIVTNILTNAIKYTERGSVSFIVNCVNDSEYCKLIISVEDTGRGIKPDQIDKLFTKFQRLDEDKNTTLEGTGLGLAITKRFVEMMGGKIVVQSKYGEGSKFTVYLRQKIVKMNKPENTNESELINTSKMKLFDFSSARVLVVDDNKINIKVALKLLSNYGIKAESSDSGFDALKRLEAGEIYDLILLDDMMPRMSGVEILGKIRENVIYDMPVIALTANALSGMKEKYIRDGFDDYLPKPIEKDELYRILINYLHKKCSVLDMPKKSEEKKELVLENTDNSKVEKTVTSTIDSSCEKLVLVVDDNKINIKIAVKILSDKGVRIESALSGKEAIEKCKNINFDLIFMDIMMPEMDGVETLHHLRDELHFDNPVIALTADAVAGSEEKYLSEGFDDYISKPISNEIIDEALEKFLH